MTSLERIASLVTAVEHVCRQHIVGDIAECGVWKGGSMMAIARTLLSLGDTSRHLYLYDTFQGMPPPEISDISAGGISADELLRDTPRGQGVWCEAGLDEVKRNLATTGYPIEKIHFIQGKVEDTIPKTIPNTLALLRLDTDWYSSTLHELNFLYPNLVCGGILFIDDYGAWQGARKAVDEYFSTMLPVYLHRVDNTGRVLVKP